MGYIVHNAIIVTCQLDDIFIATEKAKEIGLQVLGPSEPVLNNIRSILICPDGSKKNWNERDEANQKRKLFKEWLESQKFEDNSSVLDWVEVEYDEDGGSRCF